MWNHKEDQSNHKERIERNQNDSGSEEKSLKLEDSDQTVSTSVLDSGKITSNNDLNSKSPQCQCDEFDKSEFEDLKICLCSLRNFSLNLFDLQPSYSTPYLQSQPMFYDNPGQLFNYIRKCRRWIKVSRPNNTSRLEEFSLTTYNILSQNLLLNHLYLYQNLNRSDLEWIERSNRLKKELIDLNSDIFCLQEVHMQNFTTSILPWLKKLGYQEVSKQKTGENHDGCSILFKKTKFQLQDSLEIQMNRLDLSCLLDRDQIALVVKLKPIGKLRTSDTNLIIANTHLLFNPKRGDIKLAQLRLLLAEIQRFAVWNRPNQIPCEDPFKMKYFPIILCGDFNSEPGSPLIKFLENGEFNFDGLRSGDISGQFDGKHKGRFLCKNDILLNGIDSNSCYDEKSMKNTATESNDEKDLNLKHVLNLQSVYPTVDEFNNPLVSIATMYDQGLVDHLFYSRNHQNLQLAAFHQLMSKRNLAKIGSLPNSILGSDHISLSAKFYLS
ncbi:Protein angel -like protein 2 [Sarcoptes scabiei]|uniref:Protein angel -like protein 2 n=1 Tax=Sarcoptes scabiei TaxID=52283 RepID=A0A834QZM2_SARSC|nr:Protein angel -like protein 2 [Sarcoptes scabiei]